jgi:signal transduction histidine kinase
MCQLRVYGGGVVRETSPTALVLSLARRDATIAVALAVPMAIGTAQQFSWAQAIGCAALAVPLAWRQRWPIGVLAVVICGTYVYLALSEPNATPIFIAPQLVAAYTVAAHGSRSRTLAVAAGLALNAIVIISLFSPDNGSDRAQIVEELSQLGFALAIGEAVRTQRAFIAAMRDRAEREALRRVDEERVRIARDVHDVVAHSIATISTQASVGVHVGRDEPAQAVEVLESIKRVSTQALQDLRYALAGLRDPSEDGPTGPTPSLEDVAGLVQQARDSGLSVALRMEGSPTMLPLALQAACYRIVQEGLTNVLRHASGAPTTVLIAVGGDEVVVDVTNDGTGRPTSSSGLGSGTGLVGLRERAAAMGGELRAEHGSDGGFRVRAELPLNRDSA